MSLLSRGWLRDLRHPSDETLVLFLDGELGSFRKRQVSGHLETCWLCRNRRDKIEQTIGALVDSLSSAEGSQAPPRGWLTFDAKLRALAAQPESQRVERWSPGRLRYAFASAAVVALVVWAYLGSTRTVSAMELLSRAQAAESQRLRQVGARTAYQKLRIRLASARVRSEYFRTIEYRTGGAAQGLGTDDAVWRDVERILRANGMDRPLSASAHERWRSSIPRRHESVQRTTLADGADGYALDTQSALPAKPDTILESRLVVRAGDWRPVEQNLTVQAVNDVVRYELAEVAFDVPPPALAERKVETLPPAPAARPAEPVPAAPPVLLPGDPDAAEVEAHYTLHRLGACLGEPIEVVRAGSGAVVVRGLVETPERKQQLTAALAATPGISVEIRTTEEAMRNQPRRPAQAASASSEPQRSTPPLESQLEAYFKARGVPDIQQQVTELTNGAITLSQSFMAQAWALRRLSEAYPPGRAAQLRPAGQRLLQEMLSDHTAWLRRDAGQCRSLVEPVLSSITELKSGNVGEAYSGSGSGPTAVFEAARDADRFMLMLFAGTDEAPGPVTETAARLLSTLHELDARCDLFAQDLRHGLSAVTAGRETKR